MRLPPLPALAVFSLALGACTSVAIAGSPPPHDMADARKLRVDKNELMNVGSWKLESAKGPMQDGLDAMFAPGLQLALRFDSEEVSVVGGCNQMRGRYIGGSRRMEFDVAITTRMSCEDEKNLADQRISELLRGAYTVEIRETQPPRLRLIGEDGTELVFIATPMQL